MFDLIKRLLGVPAPPVSCVATFSNEELSRPVSVHLLHREFVHAAEHGKSPKEVLEEMGLTQVAQLDAVSRVEAEYPDLVRSCQSRARHIRTLEGRRAR